METFCKVGEGLEIFKRCEGRSSTWKRGKGDRQR